MDFNPQIPNAPDTNYFRYSEPIKGLEVDKSAGMAMQTAAQGIEGVASLAKSTADEYIKQKTKETIEPIRDQFTANLEAARNSLIPQPVQTPVGGVVAGGDNADQPVPDAVRSGIDKVGSLQSAFVNGKVNDTWYHGQLAATTQSLRAKYPGWTDQIDAEVSKITGVVPANAYVADLMQDINRAQTNKKTEADKMLDLARGAMTKGLGGGVDGQGMPVPKANLMYQRLEADPSFGPKFLEWYSEENSKFTRLQYENLQRENFQGNKKQFVEDRKEKLNSFLSTYVDSDLHATMKLSGMDKPDTIMGILQRASNDPNAFNEKQMEEFATRIQSHRQIMKAQFNQLTDQHQFTTDVGVAERDLQVESKLGVYDAMYKAIREGGAGGAGLAFFHANYARAALDQTKANITQGPLGEYLNNAKIVQDSLGPAFSGVIVPMLMKEGMPDKLRPLFHQQAIEARAQPGGSENPTAITDHMADVNKKGFPITKEEKPFLYKGLLNTVNDLKNPLLSDTDKANVVQYLFSPKSTSLLQNFQEDHTTPSPDRKTEVFHPGKTAAWTQLTDKAITDSIAKMDTTSKNMYKNWVEITGRELIGQDVKNLNHFTGHDNLFFTWDSEHKQIKLEDKLGALAPPTARAASPYSSPTPYTGAPTPPPSAGYIQQVQKIVGRINKAIPNLDHVYSSLGGGNTEATILQTLQQYGMDFNGNVSGLPKAFGDAVAASRKKPEESDFNKRFKGD